MAPVLIGATVLFALLAVVMSLVASKAMRDNRARSAARIAALQAAVAAAAEARTLAPSPAVTLPVASPPPSPALETPSPVQNAAWDFALRDEQPTKPPVARPASPKQVLSSHFEVPSPTEHALFEPAIPPTPGRRWTWTIAAGLMMATAAGIIYIISSGVLARVAMAKNETAIAAAASPIELLSLRHSTDASGNFVVTGLVQNPVASSSLHGVFAVAYLFDADGNYFASGRAALESAVLSPGGEAAFVVKVPPASASPTPVSRYRISFQQENGAAVNHVDRRGSVPAGTTGDSVDTSPSTAAPIVTARKNG